MQASTTCIGILAHVDAGKTTLSEALLYTTGALRKLGRVDHGDAFLDNFNLERERGITIFSKQANFAWKGMEITLLDTPGHVDFSAEMERTLQVLDYCILVISGSDGVQGHTATLWKLLKKYEIPTFVFVNKMDQPDTNQAKLLQELREKLGEGCQDFCAGFTADIAGETKNSICYDTEELAMCSEALMEEYLEKGVLEDRRIAEAVLKREVFPCFFGSALKLEGVERLLEGLRRFTVPKVYPEKFGARVYKISRDASGNRLTHLKITGGSLKVKQLVDNHSGVCKGQETWAEKVDSIRICDGAGFKVADLVKAGGICAVTGLSQTFAGQGLGVEQESELPVLVPVLTYRLVLPENMDPVKALGKLRVLEEEEPELHVVWKETIREIHVQVMGEVQIEILKRIMAERFDMDVEFADGQLLYQETIANAVEGIGHFEPLRHYAEVHLLLEPGERGSGITFDSVCSEDDLDKNWQRLIFTHLEEKTHLGVLTGSPVTDIKVTLLTGRAHLKHTEGGDFRQATYRALRQGLMQAQSVLLEPVFSFTLELPTEQLGRAMTDIQRMYGKLDAPVTDGAVSVLTGTAPVATMRLYQREVNAYTRGLGRLTCTLKGYEPCHNPEEVVEKIGYDPVADLENPPSSVFCAHGAGFVVGWQEVQDYAHLECEWQKFTADYRTGVRCDEGKIPEGEDKHPGIRVTDGKKGNVNQAGISQTGSGKNDYITREEIEEIFRTTYGKSTSSYEPYRYHKLNTGGVYTGRQGEDVSEKPYVMKQKEKPESYFLVDGYNIIFAWEDLRRLAETNIDSARDRLMDICCNFQGYNGSTLILVFDAYKVKGNPGSVMKYHNIHVVYTKEVETADQYIEKTVHRIAKKHMVTVATSDALEQMIIWGAGAVRLSARGFREEVEAADRRFRESDIGDKKLGHTIQISDCETLE